jgi:hypothetical protein
MSAPNPPVDFRAMSESLPFDDPDRHDIDPLDAEFARLAPGYPDTSNPVDFARSVRDGFEQPVDWDGPVPTRRTVTDTPTGGVL